MIGLRSDIDLIYNLKAEEAAKAVGIETFKYKGGTIKELF